MNNTQDTVTAALLISEAAGLEYRTNPSATSLAALQAATWAVRLAAVADGGYPA
jgi:hypothetical protein